MILLICVCCTKIQSFVFETELYKLEQEGELSGTIKQSCPVLPLPLCCA